MYIIAYSDLHNGKTTDYSAFHAFCDRVEKLKPDMVVEVGDGDDLVWCGDFEGVLNFAPAKEAIERQKKIAAKIRWVKIKGNHNLDIAKYAEELAPIIVLESDRMTLEGVVYLHGHQFDPVTLHCWSPWQKVFHDLLPRLYQPLWGSPRQLKMAGDDISYSRLCGVIETNLMLWADGRSVVYGHTHSEYVKVRKGQVVANCGDMYDSRSYLEVRDGVPRLAWINGR